MKFFAIETIYHIHTLFEVFEYFVLKAIFREKWVSGNRRFCGCVKLKESKVKISQKIGLNSFSIYNCIPKD